MVLNLKITFIDIKILLKVYEYLNTGLQKQNLNDIIYISFIINPSLSHGRYKKFSLNETIKIIFISLSVINSELNYNPGLDYNSAFAFYKVKNTFYKLNYT